LFSRNQKKRIEKSVGSWKLNDREFKTILGRNYEDFESRRSHWGKEDVAWKSFVSLCRDMITFRQRSLSTMDISMTLMQTQ
jgi:hypothetical protein